MVVVVVVIPLNKVLGKPVPESLSRTGLPRWYWKTGR